MDDRSPMPFGKHRGTPMEDVPAAYLLWLWDAGKWAEPGDLHDYIARSFDALLQECPDYIPLHKP